MNLLKIISNFFVCFLILTPFVLSVDSLEIISPTYFAEENNIYDPIHYLEDEPLSFKFCTDEKVENITTKLVCDSKEEKISLFIDKNKAGCYFRNYDLKKAPCDNFNLEFDFVVDSKERIITRKFEKEKQSTLINHILGLDYKNLNDKDLSYYLLVENEVNSKDSEVSKEIYNTLKESRDNNEKCWPDNNCNSITTSTILNNLKTAGYPLNSRLLEDGKQYLEKNIIENKNTSLKFSIRLNHNYNSNEEISCDLTVDDENISTYIFDKNSDGIDEYASNSIGFACNSTVDKIEFDLFNINNQIQLSNDYDSSSSFSYTLKEFSCSGNDYTCDYKSSIKNLDTYGTSFSDSSLFYNYLDSLISSQSGESKIDISDEYEDSGRYLSLKNNGDLVNFLKFKQNNDGSWGSGSKESKILKTSWAVLGLEKSEGASEHLKDGKHWIYFEEPTDGWGSIEKNSQAYLAIKEQIKPYLRINSVNEITNPTYFVINNPTIHNIKNLKISVSDNIKQYLSYVEDIGDLSGEGTLPFNITYAEPFYGTITGELKISGLDGKNNELSLLDFPINLKGPSPFSFSSKNTSLSEESPYVEIQINKNQDVFSSTCTYKNPFTNKVVSKTITQNNLTLLLDDSLLTPGNFSLKVDCNFEDNIFTQTVPFEVVIAKKTFEVQEELINISNPLDFSINVHSLITKKQTLSFSLDGNYNGLISPLEEEKIIAPNDTREVFFNITNYQFLDALGNSAKGNIIIKSEEGYIKKIPVIISKGENNNSDSSILKWVLIFFAIILLGFIVLVIIRYFQLKKIREEEGGEYDDDMYFEDDVDFK